MRTFTLKCSLYFTRYHFQTRCRPSLYTQGRNCVAFLFGVVSGEGGRLDGVFVRYGGIPAVVREY